MYIGIYRYGFRYMGVVCHKVPEVLRMTSSGTCHFLGLLGSRYRMDLVLQILHELCCLTLRLNRNHKRKETKMETFQAFVFRSRINSPG